MVSNYLSSTLKRILDVGAVAVKSFTNAVEKEPLAFIGGISLTAISIAAYKFYQKLMDSKIMADGPANFCKCPNRVKDRVVVITGGTSGIGREVVVDCAKNGAHIVVGCRDEQKGQDLKKKMKQFYDVDISILIVDFRSLESCKKFADSVKTLYPKIDFLVNNVGVFNVPYELSDDNFELTWQTNFLAHVVVTENLWGALIPNYIPEHAKDEKRDRNSVIFVSSRIIHTTTQEDLASEDQNQMCVIPPKDSFIDKIKHYGLTKLGLWNYSQYLSLYARKNKIDIDVCSVDPGSCYTSIYKDTFNSFSFNRFLHFLGTRSAKEGAQSIIHCLNKRFQLTDRSHTAKLYRNCEVIKIEQNRDEVMETLFVRKSLASVNSFIPSKGTPNVPL